MIHLLGQAVLETLKPISIINIDFILGCHPLICFEQYYEIDGHFNSFSNCPSSFKSLSSGPYLIQLYLSRMGRHDMIHFYSYFSSLKGILKRFMIFMICCIQFSGSPIFTYLLKKPHFHIKRHISPPTS